MGRPKSMTIVYFCTLIIYNLKMYAVDRLKNLIQRFLVSNG